jgi:hypothetical protein
MAATNPTSDGTAMAVWIEQVDGTIVRGVAQAASSRSARVRLAAPHQFRPDEVVMLRVSFAPDRPTVAAAAQVRWVRRIGDTVECGLDWDLGNGLVEAPPA